MRQIQRDGVPLGVESTRYDVIDPETGSALPPKLVLSIAAELATGRATVALPNGMLGGRIQENLLIAESSLEGAGRIDLVLAADAKRKIAAASEAPAANRLAYHALKGQTGILTWGPDTNPRWMKSGVTSVTL
jgi:hypothetical protein